MKFSFHLRDLQKKEMNWILVILAGLFEVAFAFCLGKAKDSAGNEMYLWYAGFVVALFISMSLFLQAW